MRRRQSGPDAYFGPFGAKSAVGYTRVSTEEQATEGVSLAAQEERIRAYCALAGLDLVDVIREEGVSGSKRLGDRPAGSRLLQLLGPNRARHVVALKLDRLFRDAPDAMAQTRRWDKAEIAMHLVDMGGQAINTATAIGRMFLTVLAALAEFERNQIAERTTVALRHLKAKRNVYATIPLGFVRMGDDLVEDRAELATVARIRDLRTLGWTYTRIAETFNTEHVPTKRGGQWYPSTVRYIERNDLYRQVA